MGAAFDRAIAAAAGSLDSLAYRRSARAPLCEAPLGSRGEYLQLWETAKAEVFPAVDRYEQACGGAVDLEWFHRLALLTQVTIKRSAVCYQHGRLLYATLVRYVRRRPVDNVTVVETGTARGFSVLCLARALRDAGVSGKISTFDVLPHDAPIFWNSIADIDGPRTRADLLSDYAELLERYVVFHRGDTRQALRSVISPRVHFAFLDSVHTYDHVMAEFAAIRGYQHPGDIVFFDDYSADAYPGVVKAADEICMVDGYAATIIQAGPRRAYLIAEKTTSRSNDGPRR